MNRWGVLLGLVLALPAGAGLAAFAGDAGAEQAEEAEEVPTAGSIGSGLAAFQRYCRTCHGKTGKGDGTIVKWLKVPPADLTVLSRENDGEFPTERVRRAIDGREEVRLHGPREMPIWGRVLQDGGDADEEQAVAKIEDLIAYLKTIQVD